MQSTQTTKLETANAAFTTPSEQQRETYESSAGSSHEYAHAIRSPPVLYLHLHEKSSAITMQ
jgi:hypothetical protein